MQYDKREKTLHRQCMREGHEHAPCQEVESSSASVECNLLELLLPEPVETAVKKTKSGKFA
jgi:hypothetical protein